MIANYLNDNVKAFRGKKNAITDSYLRRAYNEIKIQRELMALEASRRGEE